MECKYDNFDDIEKEIEKHSWKKICILLMSGGVDSSLCLVLLQKAGYSVIWVHYNFWRTYKTNKENKCCNLNDLSDAYEICNKFWVKLFNIDYSEKFKKTIIDTFLKEKSKWLHFNPCTLCHEKIKYWKILNLVKKYDIFLSSWYYCKIENWKLMRPKDEKKDQTQSLILKIKSEDLKYYVFPLWDYLKWEVRFLAKESWIKVYNKKDSMWLCFVWEKNIKDFIRSYWDLQFWDVYYFDWKIEAKIWKKHKWLWLYEYWENSWFNLKIDWNPSPLYVYKKDISNNSLIVAQKEMTLRDSFKSSEYNLLIYSFKNLRVKYNSNSVSIDCSATLDKWVIEIKLNENFEWIIKWEIFLLFSWEDVVWGWIID